MPFMKKTVASITAAFSKMVADLEQVEIQSLEAMQRRVEAIQEHTAKRDAWEAEATAARTIRNKIKALINQ